MMKKAIRPAIFKWRQTEPALILYAVRGYLRYSLGFGAWLLTLTSAGIVNRLVLWPRPAHDPAYEIEGASEIQDHVSRRELAGVRASAPPTR